tara:strand:- start:84 stop:1412 length:1329 start_codon:yes stop_codon:yes gene_type:complete
MANTQLTKSVQKNAGNDAITKMTYSVWIKRSALGEADIFAAHQLSSYYTDFYFDSNDRLNLYSYINSSEAAWVQTNRRFRDTNAWYHLVFAVDTTQGTAANRVKFYVNGTQETSMNSTVYPSQNSAFGQFSDTGATLYIGNNPNRTAFSGSMSHIHYTPYTTYDASPFGSTDATTGEWKINTSPSLTYSTAGFFILKNGNSVTDQSPNTNNFTVAAGTLTKTEDCPSNIFNTNNPLIVQSANGNHGYGNTNWSTGAASWRMTIGTVGATSGKYYAESQYYGSGSGVHWMSGIVSLDQNMTHSNQYPGGDSGKLGVGYNWDGQQYVNGSNSNYGASMANNDIIGIAMDLDNRKIYFSKNGTWQNSGVPTSGSTGTGAINIPSSTDAYTFAFSAHNSSMNCNFGNGYFGGTAVSSAGTNASEIGIFEYDVPTGYTALSTKGLNE